MLVEIYLPSKCQTLNIVPDRFIVLNGNMISMSYSELDLDLIMADVEHMQDIMPPP